MSATGRARRRRGEASADGRSARIRLTVNGEPREVLCAGDTDNDLQAGARAGVGANVAVLSGAHDRARLEKAPHDAILASAAALPDWLERRDRRAR